ncbi:hypothetical protein MUK42_20212 [Musa troglodytarum]|uniref:Metallothionein n=1 Tax=Musa troglodytarum TaxID=320322 RepID=A0A9E7K4B9_9LILI|nr:hypothetical protein MUK42_20212 [Musa troglodytarum]
MADRGCDDACGCAVPCPGDDACRCSSGRGEVRHSVCRCGDHCSCNPCTCGRTVRRPTVGREACTAA